MTLPAPMPRYTVAEYLALEERSEIRHEFHNGEILAMSGGTYEHSRINANLIGELRQRLRGSPCFVLESNMRVAIARRAIRVYPDASVVCGDPEFDPEDWRRTTITNPRVVCEVLSESAEAYDPGEKFAHYRDLESLREYVLVSQTSPMIEVFARQERGNWLFTAWQGPDAVARLHSIEIDLPLVEVYAGITFPIPSANEQSSHTRPGERHEA